MIVLAHVLRQELVNFVEVGIGYRHKKMKIITCARGFPKLIIAVSKQTREVP